MEPDMSSTSSDHRLRRARWVIATVLAVAVVAGAAWASGVGRAPADHEVWSLDQGTDRIHIYDARTRRSRSST
jgi:hypothetical protein